MQEIFVRRYLFLEAAQTLMHALIASCLDNGNPLLQGLSYTQLLRLQEVLHTAANLNCTRTVDHISPILNDL